MLKLCRSKHVDNNPSGSFYVYSGKFVVRDFLDDCLFVCVYERHRLIWMIVFGSQYHIAVNTAKENTEQQRVTSTRNRLTLQSIHAARKTHLAISSVSEISILFTRGFPLQRVFKNKNVSVISVCGPTWASTISMSGLIVQDCLLSMIREITCGSQSSSGRNSVRSQFRLVSCHSLHLR